MLSLLFCLFLISFLHGLLQNTMSATLTLCQGRGSLDVLDLFMGQQSIFLNAQMKMLIFTLIGMVTTPSTSKQCVLPTIGSHLHSEDIQVQNPFLFFAVLS